MSIVLPWAGVKGLSGAGELWRRCKPGVDFAGHWIRRALGFDPPKECFQRKLEEGLTFVLPGIEAASIHTTGMADGLSAGGVKGAMRIWEWGLPFPGGYMSNLSNIKRSRRRALDLAAEIVAYQDAYPGRPVHLMAQSGGSGVAVFATEALPEGRMVESIVVCAAALSPVYNLAKALRKTVRGMFSSYSPHDWMVLGFGTRMFGTIDRQYMDGAGRVGFQLPEGLSAAERELYETKLQQLAWHEGLKNCANWGGHLSSACEEFLRVHVAPWMCGQGAQ